MLTFFVSPDATQLGHAKVVLDNSVASGSVTRDGTFVMCGFVIICTRRNDSLTNPKPSPDVAAGTYVVSVVSHDHVFEHVRAVYLRYVPVHLLSVMLAAPHRRPCRV